MSNPRLIRSAAVLLLALPMTAQAAPRGDASAGAVLFKQRCASCHTVEKGGRNGIGPGLSGVVGKPAARVPGFAYSPALKASHLKWTPEVLEHWLAGPAKLVPGTTMMAAPIADAQARQDMIAYLKAPPSTSK